MNTELITSAVGEVLVNAALAVLSLAGVYAVYYVRLGAAKVKAQMTQIQDESARRTLEDALDDVQRLAELSVEAVEQTTAKALREAVKAGAKERSELLALGKQTFDEVRDQVAPEVQQLIIRELGSFDNYLTRCIEAAVLKVKRQDPFIALPESVLAEESIEPPSE